METWKLAAEANFIHPEGTDIYCLYGSASGIQFELNETAWLALMELSPEGTSLEEVSKKLSQQYNVEPEMVATDITPIFQILKDNNLLESVDGENPLACRS